MECICAQTRHQFILSSERVFGKWSQNPRELQGKSPLLEKFSPKEDGTHDAASSRPASHTHSTNELFRPCNCYQNRTLVREDDGDND